MLENIARAGPSKQITASKIERGRSRIEKLDEHLEDPVERKLKLETILAAAA